MRAKAMLFVTATLLVLGAMSALLLRARTESTTKPTPAAEPTPAPACVVAGDLGRLCIEAGQSVISVTDAPPELGCFREATCARQADGKCGWNQTPELIACLKAARVR